MTVAERGTSAVAIAVVLLLAVPSAGLAASCLAGECVEEVEVEKVRSLVAGACDCAGTKSHGAYVRCAKTVIKGEVKARRLLPECKSVVRRCEARSTCGRKDAMVCCAEKKGAVKALLMGKGGRCHGNRCTGAMAAVDACRQDGTCAPPRRGAKAFRGVQAVLKTSCALSSCHSTFARKGEVVLDRQDVSYVNLVGPDGTGHESAHPEAKQAGLLRVKPGDPDSSFLIRKLRGVGPGDPMPQSGTRLSDPIIDMVAAWIRRGAHTTEQECPSRVGETSVSSLCAPITDEPSNFVWHPEPPLEVPTPDQGIQLYTPPRDVAPGTEWETCYAFHPDWGAIAAQLGLPAGSSPVIRQQTYRMHEGSHHMLLYMYVGTDPNGWAPGYFPCNAANCINSADCPADAASALLLPIGGTQVAGTRYEVTYPTGVGVPVLGSNAVLIVNEHYTNPFQPPQPIYGEAWLNLYLYHAGEFKAVLDGIFAINSSDLLVEPYQSRTISSIWKPRNILTRASEDAALFQLFGHMHKRGTLFQIDYVKGGACSVSGDLCGRDADCECKPWRSSCTPGQTCVQGPAAEDTTIYYTTEWDAAPILDFPAPYFLVNHDEGLRWTCTHQNGIAGDPAHPPKKCEEDCAACGWDPGSRTCQFCKTLERPRLRWDPDQQACVQHDNATDTDVPVPGATPRVFALGDPMPLVFGLLADDDMCNMFGYFLNQADRGKLP